MSQYSPDTLKAAARAHLEAGETRQARDLLQPLAAEFCLDAEIPFLLGLAESRLGKLEAAATHYATATRLKPGSIAGWFNLGLVQTGLQRLDEAAASLEKCLAIDSGLIEAHLRLTTLCEQLGQLEKAREHVIYVLKSDPAHLHAQLQYARLQLVLGDTEAAADAFRRVIARDPSDITAVAGLADLYAKRGNIEQALELLTPLIERNPPPPAAVIVFADICQYAMRCEETVRLLENIVAQSGLPPHNRREALVALSKLHDRLEHYDEAFACISEANALKPADTGVQPFISQTNALISTWDPDFNARLPVATVQIGRPVPVFIVGMPRSGTTLVEQILAGHPRVYAAGELKALGEIIAELPRVLNTDAVYPDCLDYADSSTLARLADNYLDSLVSESGGQFQVISDKMPLNFLHLGLIKCLFPAAVILHCTRHPLDTCLSCYFTDFAEGNLYSFDLENTGRYFNQYRKIMLHWQQTLNIPMLDIPYEELVSAPESWSRRIVTYCGLEWDDNCLNPHRTRRTVTTASCIQVQQKIYTSSVARWKNYRKHLEPLRKVVEMRSTRQTPCLS